MICDNEECRKQIRGKAFTVMEDINGAKIKKHYHPICFQKVVLGIDPNE